MNKLKLHIDWNYNIIAKDDYIWVNANPDEADVIISVNRISNFNQKAKKILWLLEPRAIEFDLYRIVENRKINYDFVVSHLDTLNAKIDTIQIAPCVPSWINKEDRMVYKKSKDVSMIASTKAKCQGHRYRQEIASKLHDYVDLYGEGREKKLEYKLDGLKDYRFSVAMENSCADTYFTEKLLDCFLTGTVPIYWGTKCISKIFDHDGIIYLDDFMNRVESFDFTKEYEDREKAIIKNLEIAESLNFKVEDGIHKIIEKVYNII